MLQAVYCFSLKRKYNVYLKHLSHIMKQAGWSAKTHFGFKNTKNLQQSFKQINHYVSKNLVIYVFQKSIRIPTGKKHSTFKTLQLH